MAKKTSEGGGASTSIFDIISKVDNSAEILSESKTAVIKDYINSGSYILNAAMTGSLFKGVPCGGKCTVLAGEKSTGKSFLALSACRNGQAKGYIPIYMDSENAIDIETVKRIGCDPSRFIIRQVNTVTEVSTFILNTINALLEVPENKRDKVMFVLDSVGNLTSNKERDDLIDGNNKQDMTRNKEIKALFRTCLVPMGKIGAPFICTSHIYKTLDLYSKTVVNGGTGLEFGNSLTMLLSSSKMDDKESDKIVEKKVGDYIKTGVIVTAKPEKSRFTIPQKVKFAIPFFKPLNPYIGLEQYLTWENSGIICGKLLTEKEYSKLTDAEKKNCYEMADKNGVLCYAFEKPGSKKIVVKHLGEELDIRELFTAKVFTDEILHRLDEEVIKPNFELPSQDSFADVDELFDNQDSDSDNE